jgi:hypothetical protein
MNRFKVWVCGGAGILLLGWAFAQEFCIAQPMEEPRPVFDLPLVSPESAPEIGTFWSYSSTVLLSSPSARTISANNEPVTEYPSWNNHGTNFTYAITNSF